MNFIKMILITVIVTNSPLAFSQFEKFKSKTNFDRAENEEPMDSEPMNNEVMNNEPMQDSAEVEPPTDDDFREDDGFNDNPPPERPARVLVNKVQDNESDSGSFFGRKATEIKVDKDSKYVNLNPETAFGPEVVTSFDFPNTSLVDLTKHMQKMTGINLILDKDLKGKISIMAPSAITVGDAWKAYLTALNINGYTLVKSGSFYQIVQSRDIRYTPTNIYTGGFTPETDNYVMKIIPLKNIDSTEVTRSFRPFMSRYGRIIDIKQTNTIIVQDTGTNIKRLMRLIKFIDVPGHEESLQIIPVKNSSAQEIAKLLDTILKGGKAGAAGKFKSSTSSEGGTSGSNISKIIAEPRTNSIIAMANASGAKQLRSLIEKLDVKLVSGGSGQIHVYYLNHGDAKKLSTTLSNLVSNSSAAKAGTNKNRFTEDATGTELFNAQVKITADEENNALVVTASPTDYLTIKEVIKKLDIPRDQVYVEGMIMETQVTKNSGFGVSYLAQYGTGNADRMGFTGGSSDLMNLLTDNITSLGGLFVGGGAGSKITKTVAGQEIKISSVNALVSAIANDSNSNVLATPQLLALDNVEAEFEVGEEIPTREQTIATNGSTSTSLKSKKIALNLKIKPQINKITRFIKLDISQKVDDFSKRTLPSGVQSEGVAVSTRSAKTTVVVRDRDTVAMGGLMRDKQSETTNKVPLLGDIPVLGWLFKNNSTSNEKVNLLFFLTPRIMTPYAKSSANNVKDLLNRRAKHLKSFTGENDFFGTSAKGLYEKAKQQEQAPLYDEEDLRKFKEEVEKSISPTTGSTDSDLDVPNYRQIAKDSREARESTVQKVNVKNSATKK